MVLGLSRLRSEKTSDEMQVSCGLDMKNCRKKQIFPFISVFCVCVFMYVYVCVPVCERICSMCYVFFCCCFVVSFNALLFLHLQFIYSMCKYMF